MQILLDTHAWIWWVTQDRRLAVSARRAIQRASSAGTLLLSLISIWEVAKKVAKQHLVLDRPLESWIDDALAQPGLQTLELTRPILIESCRLPGPFHGDPADQLIVATARERDAVIVTRDDRIRRYGHVRSSW
jgi:PIN domain nuclease of toxin-antitoxin system